MPICSGITGHQYLAITLNEEHFKALVRGGIITLEINTENIHVQIALRDIQHDRMIEIIEEAKSGKDKFLGERDTACERLL